MRSQTWLTHLHYFLLLSLHSISQSLYLSEEQNHQSQMFVDPFLEGSLICQSQSNVSGLLIEVFVFKVEPFDFLTENSILDI